MGERVVVEEVLDDVEEWKRSEGWVEQGLKI
jgi:hypothetical protein